MAATVSAGQVKREKVVDLRNESYMPFPDWILANGNNSFLVPMLKIKALGGIASESKYATIKIN